MSDIRKYINNKKDIEMIEKMAMFLQEAQKGISEIQINNFVLNDVEFPTKYGKYQQAKVELASRYARIVDIYYNIRELEIKIKMKERDMEKETDELQKELLNIEIEKMMFQKEAQKALLNGILNEARIFWRVYTENKQFHNLSPEEEYKLEAENWALKTLNMPTIFEERYGSNYMKKALGEELYKQYLEVRRKSLGLLPRELFEVKQIEGGNNVQDKIQLENR